MNDNRYIIFNQSLIGAAHISKGLICQDASVSCAYNEYYIAVVSDGHGNRRHFRSHVGARIACDVTVEQIKEYIDGGLELVELKQNICDEWKHSVNKDFENNPWTDEELEEQRRILSEDDYSDLLKGDSHTLAYGCTLVAVFTDGNGYTALQIGDGSFAVVDLKGSYSWPMPESKYNDGNKTFSLCASDPMVDFRHVVDMKKTAALFVYSDGIEKAYPNEEKGIISLLFWILSEYRSGKNEKEESLNNTLQRITDSSRNGDDVSIAGIIDNKAEIIRPQLSVAQITREYETLDAQINEIDNTISYNQDRLNELRNDRSRDNSESIKQIESIIERKKNEREQLNLKRTFWKEKCTISNPSTKDSISNDEINTSVNAKNKEDNPCESNNMPDTSVPMKESKDCYLEKAVCEYRIDKKNSLKNVGRFGSFKGYLDINNNNLSITKAPVFNGIIQRVSEQYLCELLNVGNPVLVLNRERVKSINKALAYKMEWRVIEFDDKEMAVTSAKNVIADIDKWYESTLGSGD